MASPSTQEVHRSSAIEEVDQSDATQHLGSDVMIRPLQRESIKKSAGFAREISDKLGR
jgi:hypothetical protein